MTIGYAMCGSFCTLDKSISHMKTLIDIGYNIIPIISFNVKNLDTKFGKATEFRQKIEDICDNKIISSIEEAEPIGPKNLIDLLVIAPCTGNTLSKISLAITDTPVTMATKSQLRVNKPVLIALCSNDALGLSAQNIGKLLCVKNIFFVPMYQDDIKKKPNSLVSNFEIMQDSIKNALDRKQTYPIFNQI